MGILILDYILINGLNLGETTNRLPPPPPKATILPSYNPGGGGIAE
jgi:hypothetical protein